MAAMLDPLHDQASGLAAMNLRPPTRVLPIVHSSAGSTYSLELMWRLERAMLHLGLTVHVTEGARGLTVQDASQGHQAVLQHWLEGVPAGAVVLLHAPLEALAVLLADSAARPLVAVTEDPRALVEAYNACKVLSQAAGLQPVIITLLREGPSWPAADNQDGIERLRLNCASYLSAVPSVWSLGYHHSMDGATDRFDESCALKVLDTALVLEETESPIHVHFPNKPRPKSAADPHAGVSDVHRQRHA
jgi:hypothetical protein